MAKKATKKKAKKKVAKKKVSKKSPKKVSKIRSMMDCVRELKPICLLGAGILVLAVILAIASTRIAA